MLRTLAIKTFKSIHQEQIELGQVNIFIGENGSGKSNILEALAFLSAAKEKRLDGEGLYSKGVRVAKPTLTFSSFRNGQQGRDIEIRTEFDDKFRRNRDDILTVRTIFTAKDTKDLSFNWKCKWEIVEKKLLGVYNNKLLRNYLIYNLNTRSLRGLIAESKKNPLGIHGEGLDIFLAYFSTREMAKLKEFFYLINWLDDIVIDREDIMRFDNFKLGKSTSLLYFKDRFMRNSENIFSAENSNDGILHVLFYLALFISKQTPQLFAIDNIESNLNPHLGTHLIDVLCQLAKENHKQALITTHNPAILDGLDLNDDDIRLFEVYRSDAGYTKTRRIQLNPATKPVKMKLSELWMRGYLGAISKQF